MKKTLNCSSKLTFWLDTASSMWIFVDWKTSHTFLMGRTVYTMKRCEPLCWAAIIYHERWSSEAEQESAKAIALKNNGHYSLKMFLVLEKFCILLKCWIFQLQLEISQETWHSLKYFCCWNSGLTFFNKSTDTNFCLSLHWKSYSSSFS